VRRVDRTATVARDAAATAALPAGAATSTAAAWQLVPSSRACDTHCERLLANAAVDLRALLERAGESAQRERVWLLMTGAVSAPPSFIVGGDHHQPPQQQQQQQVVGAPTLTAADFNAARRVLRCIDLAVRASGSAALPHASPPPSSLRAPTGALSASGGGDDDASAPTMPSVSGAELVAQLLRASVLAPWYVVRIIGGESDDTRVCVGMTC
jgi:hypothetical protein